MILKKWEDLPEFLRTDAVRPYYDALARKVFAEPYSIPAFSP